MPDRPLDIPHLLAALPLFSALGADDIAHIAAGTRERRLEKGAVLFHRGDAPKGFFMLVEGQVKLAVSSPQGNEKIVEVIGPGQSFGEAVLFLERPYPVLAQALADSVLLHVSRAALFELLEQDPHFARRVLAGMAIRLHGMVRDVEAYSLRSSAQRVIGYLLQLADAAGPADGAPLRVSLPTSKQVLASRLNLTPETLSRILGELAAQGLLTVHGRDIVLHDPAALARHEG